MGGYQSEEQTESILCRKSHGGLHGHVAEASLLYHGIRLGSTGATSVGKPEAPGRNTPESGLRRCIPVAFALQTNHRIGNNNEVASVILTCTR